ncbi:MAG: alpha-galactosidase [Phycisphaerae bacterium]
MPSFVENRHCRADLVGRPGCFLTYTARPSGRRVAITAPAFELDGRLVKLAVTEFRQAAEPRRLPNGCTEHHFAGPCAAQDGLSLEVVIRIPDDNPVVRFHYILRGDRPRRMTKSGGTDSIEYLGISLADWPSATEVRLSDFHHPTHSYMPVEQVVDQRQFDSSLDLMGPILLGEGGGQTVLVAYEHGSTTPNKFLSFRLSPSRQVGLAAVKGNYWTGRVIDGNNPYETIWFDLAVVDGGADGMAATFRHFILHRLALRPASRTPYIFYNTWALQERDKWYRGHKYLDTMHQERMLAEIDAAHRMGIEVFVLDTGWYEKTGDWQVNLARFGDGLKTIGQRLDSYGMKLGLWFGPTHAARSSRMLAAHRDCVMSLDGKTSCTTIWETEESLDLCLTSRFRDAFADELIRLANQTGVRYFKWDALQQYGCDAPGHLHGDDGCSPRERADCYAFELVRSMVHIVERLTAAVPDAIVDFDVTESARCVGLAFLSAGKYFLINNGPYYFNYDVPVENEWINILVYPGPARTWVCRAPLAFDRWIPSVLFLTHYLPDDPARSQEVNVASLILGQNGLWGELTAVSPEGVNLIARLLGLYKQVRDDVTAAPPRRAGIVGGPCEVHEKINPATGRGVVCIFSTITGPCSYVTAGRADRSFWASEGVKVSFTAGGQAKIDIDFPDRGGAKIVFFGVWSE